MSNKYEEKLPLVLKCEFIVLGILLMVLLCLDMFDGSTSKSNYEKKHECINFVKYNEHYMITPMSWGYRISFKCIECGKDYKD